MNDHPKEVLEHQLTYWQEQLRGAPILLELPTDHPRQAYQRVHIAHRAFVLPPALGQNIQLLSQQADATLFVTLFATFQVLLYRYSGQEDIVVGTLVAKSFNRSSEEPVERFVNILPLRTRLRGEMTFRELLGQVREVVSGAYAHQELPLDRLLDVLHVEDNFSYHPLFQVTFGLNTSHIKRSQLPELTASQLKSSNKTANFDLALEMQGTVDRLQGQIEYNTDIFEAGTIERMIGHWKRLLAAALAHPDQPIGMLPLLSEQEQTQLVVEWNATRRDYPTAACLHHLFEAQVLRTPQAPAVLFEGVQLTYQELNARANQLAHYLHRLGAGPDRIVGVYMERSVEMVVSLLGILKAGGAYVPLDPGYPAERLAFMVEDTATTVLLTQAPLLSNLPSYQGKVLCLDTDWDLIHQEAPENLPSPVTSDHLAYVIYTSGSTGKPKGVMIAHQAICNRLLWMQETYQLTDNDSVVQKTPFNFDVSIWEFFWPLITGARLVIALPEGHKDSAYLVSLIKSQNISIIHFVPSMLQIFLKEPDLAECTSLRQVFCSGETLPLDLSERFFRRHNADLHNLYGPTEAAIEVTYWKCRRNEQYSNVPIGRPVANTHMYVLDRYRQPVPVGVAGELYIGGVQIARGYLNRPDLTAEGFIEHTFEQGRTERLYRTGDLARYLPDGALEYRGRIDHQVKLRGFRIELGEIEAVLGEHPQVEQCVAIVQEDMSEAKRLVAYLIMRGDASSSVAELRTYMKERVPEYMVPTIFEIVDEFPLTPNGKVDRRALALSLPNRQQQPRTILGPRNPIEEVLVSIWSEVLEKESISINDNFFDLGGHSLLANQCVWFIQDILQVKVPLHVFLAKPTIIEQYQYIELEAAELHFDVLKAAQLFLQVHQLSDDEIQALIS